MSKDILFDNIIITDDVNEADSWAAQTYDLKRKQLDQESVRSIGNSFPYDCLITFFHN